ncbi:kynurenine formamidase isoform X2 [Sceloporus undulatus]|uniref:kynurenine formamidase isoform X2 n=1 Tax=Sceloporus undulatus TaxID=8520 RepID=UPI001C4B4157|nr:kynurenine formamidase isoform X2 [Sceloporus undulatus]
MGKWQEMTKKELETQYSPSRWSPRLNENAVIEAHEQVTSEGTHYAQAATQTLLNVPYGMGEGEKLDVYLPKVHSESFPLVLYIHGGYWQALSKDVSGFAAVPLVTHGIALAVVGYDVAPKGSLDKMVRQVRQSVAFAVQQYTGISGVYLLGHSAGAHLAAMVLSTDWAEFGVVPNIKGAFLVSGIYDLEPITHTYVNEELHMSREVAQENSPLQCVPKLGDKRACQALRAAGWNSSLLDIGVTDHFDVIENLSQEDYLLTQVIVKRTQLLSCRLPTTQTAHICFCDKLLPSEHTGI